MKTLIVLSSILLLVVGGCHGIDDVALSEMEAKAVISSEAAFTTLQTEHAVNH